nr:MAG TPA: hypothetical protein [Caudoviricetes sp.]
MCIIPYTHVSYRTLLICDFRIIYRITLLSNPKYKFEVPKLVQSPPSVIL